MGARMGGDGDLGRHRQVDRHSVAGLHPEPDEGFRQPGHLPGELGVRIEDLVIIGENEPEVLTTFTKELVTVG